MSTISKRRRTKLRSWLRFRYRSETNLLIPELVKIEAKRTLLIPHLRKIEAKQILFIPQIQKIEAERALFIPQIGKIEANRSLFQVIDSQDPIPLANVALARICKRLRSPGIDSEESIPPTYVTWRAGTKSRVVVPARQAGNQFWAP
jgi:hypothetical protein